MGVGLEKNSDLFVIIIRIILSALGACVDWSQLQDATQDATQTTAMQLETIINSAIINGNRIQENGIGTIFANENQLKEMDCHSNKQEKARRALGAEALGDLDKRNEGGEVRYYDGANRYAIVSRSMRVLWFTKRSGGWHAA